MRSWSVSQRATELTSHLPHSSVLTSRKQARVKMVAISLTISQNPNSNTNALLHSLPKHLLCRFSSNSRFFHRPFLHNLPSFSASPHKFQTSRSQSLRVSPSSTTSTASHTYDVVVIGAGIIGLTIARQFLLESDLSVAVVDAAIPCAGATGAGILSLSLSMLTFILGLFVTLNAER